MLYKFKFKFYEKELKDLDQILHRVKHPYIKRKKKGVHSKCRNLKNEKIKDLTKRGIISQAWAADVV